MLTITFWLNFLLLIFGASALFEINNTFAYILGALSILLASWNVLIAIGFIRYGGLYE